MKASCSTVCGVLAESSAGGQFLCQVCWAPNMYTTTLNCIGSKKQRHLHVQERTDSTFSPRPDINIWIVCPYVVTKSSPDVNHTEFLKRSRISGLPPAPSCIIMQRPSNLIPVTTTVWARKTRNAPNKRIRKINLQVCDGVKCQSSTWHKLEGLGTWLEQVRFKLPRYSLSGVDDFHFAFKKRR